MGKELCEEEIDNVYVFVFSFVSDQLAEDVLRGICNVYRNAWKKFGHKTLGERHNLRYLEIYGRIILK